MRNLKKAVLLLVLTILAGNMFSQNVLDGVYVRDNYKTRKVIPYTPLREADVMWSRRIWRVIDLREKINLPFYYPTEAINNRMSLYDVIKNALLQGRLTAYSNPDIDEEFKTPMTKSDLEKVLSKEQAKVLVDSVTGDIIPDPSGGFTLEPIPSSEIKQFLIKEDWFFDKQKSVMEVRIVGICPLREKYTESNDFLGYVRMFWVYYPECRPVFANAEVFNRHNMSERRTFEDIIWKRQFNSYIVQEENVYNRRIVEYFTGAGNLGALMESDRIKQDIFEFEHDLWHF